MNRAMTLLIVLTLFPALAPAVAADSGFQPLVVKFFATLEAGEPLEALNELYATNPWMERAKDQVDKLKTQFTNLPELVGAYRSHSLLAEESVAERLVYMSYFVAYERQPIRFEFVFYRPRDKWILYSFSYDDKIDEDLKAQGRAASANKVH